MSKALKKKNIQEIDFLEEDISSQAPKLKAKSKAPRDDGPPAVLELVKKEKSVPELRGERNRIEQQCQKLKIKMNELNHDIENIRGDLVFKKSQFEEAIRNHEDEISKLVTVEDEYKDKVHELKLNSSILQDEINSQRKMAFKELGKLKLEKEFLQSENQEYESNLRLMKKNIHEVEQEEKKKLESIEKINSAIDERKSELDSVQGQLKKFQEELNEQVKAHEELCHKKEELEKVIDELSLFEDNLTREKEIALVKMQNEIDSETKRFEYDRSLRLKNLSKKIAEKESRWQREFDQKKYKLEAEIHKKEMDAQRKYQSYLSDLDQEKEQVISLARSEAGRIKKDAELLLAQAYDGRQKLLDEGSQKKMESLDFATHEIRKAQEEAREIRNSAETKKDEIDSLYREKCREAEIMINSARSRSSLIIQKAQRESKSQLAAVETKIRNCEADINLKENKFQEEINERRQRFKDSLTLRRNRFESYVEQQKKSQDHKFQKNVDWLKSEFEKTRRKQLRKLVHLKDGIISETQQYVDNEKQKIRELRKRELEDLYRSKKELILQKETLESEIDAKYKALKKTKEKEIAHLQKNEIEKNRLRRQELENEFETKMREREKELIDYYHGEDKEIRQGVLDYIKANFNQEADLGKVKKEIAQIFDSRKSDQKNKILENAAFKQTEVNEKNLSTFFWRYGVKGFLPVLVISLFGADFYGMRSLLFEKSQLFLSEIREESEQADKAIVEKAQHDKKYHPKMSKNFKDSYVLNVIHTTNFVETYESDEFQNDWLLGAYEFLTNELELPEEIAINFVSSEGALIKELSGMRQNINIRFLDNELAKMKEREAKVMKDQSDQFFTPENWKAFLAYRNQFYGKYFK